MIGKLTVCSAYSILYERLVFSGNKKEMPSAHSVDCLNYTYSLTKDFWEIYFFKITCASNKIKRFFQDVVKEVFISDRHGMIHLRDLFKE